MQDTKESVKKTDGVVCALGKIGKRQSPPRMTPKLRQDVIKFEKLKAQFAFLRENGLSATADMDAFIKKSKDTLTDLTNAAPS